MKSTRIIFIISLTSAFAFGLAGMVFAASQLTLAPSGSNSLVLQGATMENVAAIDITLTYDPAVWANPRVNKGSLTSGALTAINTNSPGTVRIGVISTKPIHGNGDIATFNFDAKGNAPGRPFGLNASLTTLDGNSLPVSVRVINPPDPGPTTPDRATLVEEFSSTTLLPPTSSLPTPPSQTTPAPKGRLGMVMLPNFEGGETEGDLQGNDSGSAGSHGSGGNPGSEELYPGRSADKRKSGTSEHSERGIHDVKSILDRFKEYAGDRCPQDLISLFEPEPVSRFRQNPSIVLADGETMLEVAIFSQQGHKLPLDLAVMGAQLVSIEEAPDNSRMLILNLVPAKGVYQASLVLPLDDLMVVVPLGVAPRLNADLDNSGTVTESDFTLFLKEGAPFDLNGDGKRDYLDDYLFTANYLAARQGVRTAAPKAKTGTRARPGEGPLAFAP